MLDYNFLLDKFIDIVYSARLVRKSASIVELKISQYEIFNKLFLLLYACDNEAIQSQFSKFIFKNNIWICPEILEATSKKYFFKPDGTIAIVHESPVEGMYGQLPPDIFKFTLDAINILDATVDKYNKFFWMALPMTIHEYLENNPPTAASIAYIKKCNHTPIYTANVIFKHAYGIFFNRSRTDEWWFDTDKFVKNGYTYSIKENK